MCIRDSADTDEEKRLASAQQSKTSPLSVDKEHETGVFYGLVRLFAGSIENPGFVFLVHRKRAGIAFICVLL